jgi:hypothetical protein
MNKRKQVVLTVILMAAMVAPSLLAAFPAVVAYAQQPGAPGVSRRDIIDANYSGPVFLDAFWTNRTSPPPQGTALEKIEVGSGDGASVLAVTLVNRGFSEITGITGTLMLPAGFTAAGGSGNAATATFNNLVAPGDTFTLFFQVNVTDKAAVKDYVATLDVEFSRTLEVGQPRTAELSVPFKVTGKVILDASSTGAGVSPGAASKARITITNTGSAPATGVVVTVPGSSGINPATQQASMIALGQKTFELGVIPAGGSATIEPTFYASSLSGESLQTVTLQVAYGDAYGARKVASIPVGMISLPESATTSALRVSAATAAAEGQQQPSSAIITAGKITDLKLTVANNDGKQPLSGVVVSIAPQSDSIKILGNTSWNIGDMAPSSTQELSTKVFASTDAIGKAAAFKVTAQHVSAAGQPEVETTDLGIYVDGEISIRAYDIALTYIGGKPNITGNLLNEGNVLALFTTVELVSAGDLVKNLPPQQYLGDLTENSPLPFSIPVDAAPGAAAGTYPVVIRVQYKDSLREMHTFQVEGNVKYSPEEAQAAATTAAAGSQGGAGGGRTGAPAATMTTAAVAIGVIAAVAIAAFVVIRRRKRNALRRTIQYSKQDDIESALDSQLKKSSGKPEERK